MTVQEFNTESEIIHENQEKKYFTQIPNIICLLGLDPYEFRLYFEYQKVARSNTGSSYWRNKVLAENCGMSERKLQECKLKLSQKFDLLGCPLITIQHRKKPDNTWDSDLITVIDIWPINMQHLATEEIKKSSGGAPGAGGVVHDMHQGGAPGASKQEPKNNNQTTTTEELPAAPVVVSSDKEKKELLKPYGFNNSVVETALEYDIESIRVALDCVEYSNNVEDLNGFMISALKKKWTPNYPKELIEKETQKEEVEKKYKEQLKKYEDLKKEMLSLANLWTGKLIEGYDIWISDERIYVSIKGAEREVSYQQDELNYLKIFRDTFKQKLN